MASPFVVEPTFRWRGKSRQGRSEPSEQPGHGLSPRREAQAGAGAGGGAVARNVFEPVQVEMLDGAGQSDPIENLRAPGVQLVARKVLQEAGVLAGAGLEDRAIEFLIHQEM